MNNSNMVQPAVSSDLLPTLPINRFRTADIDEHARNMGGWQVCYDQLTPDASTAS